MQAKCLSFLCILIAIYNQYCAYVLCICCNLLEKYNHSLQQYG